MSPKATSDHIHEIDGRWDASANLWRHRCTHCGLEVATEPGDAPLPETDGASCP